MKATQQGRGRAVSQSPEPGRQGGAESNPAGRPSRGQSAEFLAAAAMGLRGPAPPNPGASGQAAARGRGDQARAGASPTQATSAAPQSTADRKLETKDSKPFTVSGSGERKVLTPKSPNGKTLYFFFGYTGSETDIGMRDSETADLEDDVIGAAASGFLVIYDKAGTRAEFFEAVNDSNCYGIYWSGHGYMNGNIQSSDGQAIRPEDVDVTKRSPKITYLILESCGSGKGADKWKKAMGSQCQFEGWVETTTTSEANDFTSSAVLGDSWISHGGMNPDKELADYISDAGAAQ